MLNLPSELRFWSAFAVLAIAASLTGGCKGTSEPGPPPPATPSERTAGTVPAVSGGEVAFSSGLRVTVPPGALPVDTTVTFTGMESPGFKVWRGYSRLTFAPNPVIAFAADFILSINPICSTSPS